MPFKIILKALIFIKSLHLHTIIYMYYYVSIYYLILSK